MRIEYMPTGSGDRAGGPFHWAHFYVDGKDQEGRTPQTVCNVEISHPSDGKRAARFFVTVGIDSGGRPWASITGLKPNTDTTKRVGASWLDFAARMVAKIGGGA